MEREAPNVCVFLDCPNIVFRLLVGLFCDVLTLRSLCLHVILLICVGRCSTADLFASVFWCFLRLLEGVCGTFCEPRRSSFRMSVVAANAASFDIAGMEALSVFSQAVKSKCFAVSF